MPFIVSLHVWLSIRISRTAAFIVCILPLKGWLQVRESTSSPCGRAGDGL